MKNTALQTAVRLQDEIEEIENFIRLIKVGQKFEKEYEGQNEFCVLELKAAIWTGTQNPTYSRKLNNANTIKNFVNVGLYELNRILEEKKKEFEKLIPN